MCGQQGPFLSNQTFYASFLESWGRQATAQEPSAHLFKGMNCAREKPKWQYDTLHGIKYGLTFFLLLFSFYTVIDSKIYFCVAKFILLINGEKNNYSIYEVRTTVISLEEVMNSISTYILQKKHSSGLKHQMK